ncbi:MAG: UDP-N-acetylmuramoyl-tripeptide--D-alanyl-D-alanine ligase, partial [Bacteroidales bacterium]|nr:UDP-N-acetylmuramoyl-tripeptide--D-alanyl-D-alanine ligase [Bacteroidales bacterium]
MQIAQLYELFLQYPIITTDSRNCAPNSIFFALKGDRFDGNEYIEQALHNGAAYALSDKKNFLQNDRIIVVENVLQTLQDLANYHRKKMAAKVIAITGTNGKTTTKELVAQVLSAKYSVLYTRGNLNNHIGVPLTLLGLKQNHKFAIIEMGANHIGEIYQLCRIAEPDYGIITNIGKAHLEGFGSMEGVIKAKTELYNYLRNKGGAVFVNQENSFLKDFYKGLFIIPYGTASNAPISGKIIKEDSSSTFSLEWKKGKENYTIKTQLIGNYNLENVLAAICIGSYFDVPEEMINKAISAYAPNNNRSQIIKTHKNVLLLDAYNANPSSMEVAIEDFVNSTLCPKIIVLGEMKELGSSSKEEHGTILE